MNNEELQSRREFFKKAAKATLPMIAAVALAGAPAIVNASESQSSCAGCNNRCMNFCTTTCHGNCKSHCADTCYSSCKYRCSRVSQ